MFGDTNRSRILFLGGHDHAVLERMLDATWTGVQVEALRTAAVDWLPQLSKPEVGGIVALTDCFRASDLHALEAVLATRPELSALLLVGGRGLAGFEPLLQLAAVTVLPEPWTPAALELLSPPVATAVSSGPADSAVPPPEEQEDGP